MAKLESLRAFVVVTRHGNLKDAAAELGRTQSALSMALGQLEDALGGPLFETDRKRDLTDLGAFVRDLAQDLIRDHDRAQDLIYGYARGEAGHLRIASVPSVAALILPDLLSSFMTQHTGARIDLSDSDSTNVRRLVTTGQADIGIAGWASTERTLSATALFHDRLQVVCTAQHAFADTRTSLHWSDLADHPLIVNEAFAAVTTSAARDLMARSKLSARNILSLFAMVKSGLGITVLPGLATRSLDPALAALPLTGPSSTRAIYLLTRNNRTESPLATAFRKHLRAAMPDIMTDFDLTPAEVTS